MGGQSNLFVFFQVQVISESYFPGVKEKSVIQEDFSDYIPLIKHHKAVLVSSFDFYYVFVLLLLILGDFY